MSESLAGDWVGRSALPPLSAAEPAQRVSAVMPDSSKREDDPQREQPKQPSGKAPSPIPVHEPPRDSVQLSEAARQQYQESILKNGKPRLPAPSFSLPVGYPEKTHFKETA